MEPGLRNDSCWDRFYNRSEFSSLLLAPVLLPVTYPARSMAILEPDLRKDRAQRRGIAWVEIQLIKVTHTHAMENFEMPVSVAACSGTAGRNQGAQKGPSQHTKSMQTPHAHGGRIQTSH